ncbi:MAG: hypothetical protein JKY34_12580 [Kordiimonadaceae bacterium]|nr:hypothetical protein [Kordiimonadaceae bacterium]PCJ37781.1 MAG: hypothetical protein COA75_03400 [Cellvibrionales bacterium]
MKIDIAQLAFIDPTLRDILLQAEKATGFEFTITSLYRIGDKGVHGTLPLRGADLRVRLPAAGEVMADYINARWQYDSERPAMRCAVLHGMGANLHLHVQVHPRTGRA